MLSQKKWYHLWISSIARSTLSYWLNKTDYKIFQKLFYVLLQKCEELNPNNRFTFNNPLYSIDSSTITLAINIFTRAKYQKKKWAIKMHTILNNRTFIPEFIDITDWKTADIKAIRNASYEFEEWSIVTFDRWYLDFEWRESLNQNKIYFVSRIKCNTDIVAIKQSKIFEEWVLSDEIIYLMWNQWVKCYPGELRLVKYYDKEHDVNYDFITNNFELSAKTIADIYKDRRQIELFFKWIKQHLKIKSFFELQKML